MKRSFHQPAISSSSSSPRPPSPHPQPRTLPPPTMRLSKFRPSVKYLFFLTLPLLLYLHATLLSKLSPTVTTLPIHQISLSRSSHPQTTRVLASVTRSLEAIPGYVNALSAETVVYITAGCVTPLPNVREVLYLALLHHSAPAVVPYHNASDVFPIMTRARELQAAGSVENAIRRLHPRVLEVRSGRVESTCDILTTENSRAEITVRSSRALPLTMFGSGVEQVQPPLVAHVPYIPAVKSMKTVLFVTPWLQMGGSEQSMFHLANYAKHEGYRVAFMVTQPFFGEDEHGLLETKNDWIDRAYRITDHVLDLVNVAPYYQRARVMRYFLQTMNPGYIITSNSRFFYSMLPFVRGLLDDVVIADYNHMVHLDWLGGGMPRYGANSTQFIDRHFAASDNVTRSIRKWVKDDGHDEGKAKTCYIGTDVSSFHTGDKKEQVRWSTRQKLGIGPDRTLILFAGRFVLDKGIDVVVEVIDALKSNDRFAFLLVGSGGLEETVYSLRARGRVSVQPTATSDEMKDYYSASDILLLPSVKEGIALVIYEALANGLLVISTYVGGQGELVTPGRGVLLRRGPTQEVKMKVLDTLRDLSRRPKHYANIIDDGEKDVRRRFTTTKFCECVFRGLAGAWDTRKRKSELSNDVLKHVGRVLKEERSHGLWAWRVYPHSVAGALTVGVVHGCGRVSKTVSSLDGFNVTVKTGESLDEVSTGVDTELLLIVPAGVDVSQTDLQNFVNVARRPLHKVVFDMVGLRVSDGTVGRLSERDGKLERCVLGNVDELGGGGEGSMTSLDAAHVVEVGMEVLKANWLDEAFVVRTELLKEVRGKGMGASELFVHAFREGWNVGYVHDVQVVSTCDRNGVEGDVKVVGDCGVKKDEEWFRIRY